MLCGTELGGSVLQSIVGDSVVVRPSDVISAQSITNSLIGVAMFPSLGARLEDVHCAHFAGVRVRK